MSAGELANEEELKKVLKELSAPDLPAEERAEKLKKALKKMGAEKVVNALEKELEKRRVEGEEALAEINRDFPFEEDGGVAAIEAPDEQVSETCVGPGCNLQGGHRAKRRHTHRKQPSREQAAREKQRKTDRDSVRRNRRRTRRQKRKTRRRKERARRRKVRRRTRHRVRRRRKAT